MSIAAIFEILLAALKFPSEMTAFVKLLSKSDDQKRQEIAAAVEKQLEDFQNSGRPS